MNKTITTIFLIAAIIFGTQTTNAQSNIITFKDYLQKVQQNNISYLVEKYNVNIAEANAQAAKMISNPELYVGYYNNQDWSMQMGQGIEAELSYTFEMGKRKARIEVARSEAELQSVILEDYFRNLRADATLLYVNALVNKQKYELVSLACDQMNRLARADSLRFVLGEITQTDAMQSLLEARMLENEKLQMETEYRNTLIDIAVVQGELTPVDALQGELRFTKKEYNLPQLTQWALQNRNDLQVEKKKKKVSEKNLKLAKANRMIDLGISIGGSYNMEVLNEDAPSPAFKGITAGITIPLPFSAINKGEVRAVQYEIKQWNAVYNEVELQISKEVVQAYNQYLSASLQLEKYQNFILADAETILKNKNYSYLRGEDDLLELLIAQRTYNEVQQDYCQTLEDYYTALIELQRAAGVWDIEL
jgi:cobalt-zinc-cadmium efflux system outer membrane protein